MDIKTKDNHQQHIQPYRVVKAGQLLHQGKWLTKSQIQKKFPHLMGALNEMDIITSKGKRTNLSGHRRPPTYSTNSKHNSPSWHFFYIFSGLKLSRSFWGPKWHFFDVEVHKEYPCACPRTIKMFTSWLDLSNLLPNTPNRDNMQ